MINWTKPFKAVYQTKPMAKTVEKHESMMRLVIRDSLYREWVKTDVFDPLKISCIKRKFSVFYHIFIIL